jgi:hypothetical protein
MPRFLGSLPLPPGTAEGAVTGLCLEDLTSPYSSPCVMDVKMGSQSWDASASAEKRCKEDLKWPAQARLGLRFTGMSVNGTLHGRSYCHALPCEGDAGPLAALATFLSDGQGSLRLDAAAAFVAQLRDILAWFTVQSEFLFISSSLLFVYEGGAARSTSTTTTSSAPPPTLRMIDFAHVHSLQAQQQGLAQASEARDQGYITGLHTLIRCLEGLCAADPAARPAAGAAAGPCSGAAAGAVAAAAAAAAAAELRPLPAE